MKVRIVKGKKGLGVVEKQINKTMGKVRKTKGLGKKHKGVL